MSAKVSAKRLRKQAEKAIRIGRQALKQAEMWRRMADELDPPVQRYDVVEDAVYLYPEQDCI